MEFLEITCPTCWQSFDIDQPPYSDLPVSLVTDCEVCCRPMEVTLHWETTDDPPSVEVRRES